MTTENNKIIAKFIGLKSDELGYYRNGYHLSTNLLKMLQYTRHETDLHFHSDWNWLMQVVEKIYTIDLYYDKYIEFNSSIFSNGKIELSTRIDLVYNQCVEFIKWYNEQKK